MRTILEFTVPAVPPSYNESFKINFRAKQIYLSQEAKEFKKLLMLHVPMIDEKDFKPNSTLSIDLIFYDNWYYKNGNMRKKDVQNMDKIVIDSLFKLLPVDDCYIWINTNTKVQTLEMPHTVVRLNALD